MGGLARTCLHLCAKVVFCHDSAAMVVGFAPDVFFCV